MNKKTKEKEKNKLFIYNFVFILILFLFFLFIDSSIFFFLSTFINGRQDMCQASTRKSNMW